MKYFLAISFSILLPGCGTLVTTTQSDYEVGRNLIKARTNCNSISRIYGGVSYNLCKLDSKASNYSTYMATFAILDGFLSAGLDTLALPVSIYQQNKNGNIKLKEHLR